MDFSEKDGRLDHLHIRAANRKEAEENAVSVLIVTNRYSNCRIPGILEK